MTDQCCPMGTYGTDSGGYPRPVCSCLEDCECMCLNCICDHWGDDGESWSSGPSLVELDAYGDFTPERSSHHDGRKIA